MEWGCQSSEIGFLVAELKHDLEVYSWVLISLCISHPAMKWIPQDRLWLGWELAESWLCPVSKPYFSYSVFHTNLFTWDTCLSRLLTFSPTQMHFTILLRFILREIQDLSSLSIFGEYRGNNIPNISQGLLCDMQISISNISRAEVSK